MPRTRVAVLFGGRSTEHAISCVSAGSVIAALDPQRYDVVAVGITREGRWVLAAADPGQLAISGRELPQVKDGAAVALLGDPTRPGLLPLEGPSALAQLAARVDVVFPVLHGPYGEDGTVQGLLEMAGVPYVGSGVLASAAAMDKDVAKRLLASAGLDVAPWTVVRDGDWRRDPGAVRDAVGALGLPVFVKPARGGSSIGISKVSSGDELEAALLEAFRADPKVLVEAMVSGREVECGVLETVGGPPQVSVPAEITLGGDYDFYDFEAKYLDGATGLTCPADLPEGIVAALQEQAGRAFAALDCAGLARVDSFVAPDGRLVVNEVNTMPGFTPSSVFPLAWARSGVPYPALVDRLVQLALARRPGLR